MGFAEYADFDGLGLADLVARGEISPAELVDEAIGRSERVQARLNAVVIPMYGHARSLARAPLAEGPFRGVPFLLKDLIACYAGQLLQGGSRLYEGHVPDHDSELVRRYKEAGLVVFGRTNTPELGLSPTTEPRLYGPAHNPWRLGVTPGGSSGGSAAAVAAGVVPMAHGSDGGGSLRIPASCCGIFGFKPTRGRTPAGPDASEILLGYAIEHALTRSVRDSAALLDATAGPEGTSPYHPPHQQGSFLDGSARPPGRLRIAFTSQPLLPGEGDRDCEAAVADAAALCEELGHVVEPAHPEIDGREFARDFFLSFAAAVAGEMEVYEHRFGKRPGPRDVETATWLLVMIGRSVHAGAFMAARRRIMAAGRQVMRFFDDYDLLLTPTLGRAPARHGELSPRWPEALLHDIVARGRMAPLLGLPGAMDRAIDRAFSFTPFSPPFNVTGQPAMSVPLWWNADGLPMGVSFTGRFGDDALLFGLAGQLEQARPWAHRRPPVFAG